MFFLSFLLSLSLQESFSKADKDQSGIIDMQSFEVNVLSVVTKTHPLAAVFPFLFFRNVVVISSLKCLNLV